ncbi:TPA: HAD hydrolase family protein, partial [Neisseria gonorrhoeae]
KYSLFFEVFMNLPFRAMVSDLGGTLLTPEHLVGDLTIDTLRVLEQKGVDIILATGRNHTDMSSILGKIGAERAVMITSKRCSCTGFTG